VEDKARFCFRMFDADHSGVLGPVELAQFIYTIADALYLIGEVRVRPDPHSVERLATVCFKVGGYWAWAERKLSGTASGRCLQFPPFHPPPFPSLPFPTPTPPSSPLPLSALPLSFCGQEANVQKNGLIDSHEFLDWIVERRQAADLVVRH
jgi:hypothetical protein